MHILNQTQYDDGWLRRVLTATYRYIEQERGALPQWYDLEITVAPAKDEWCDGNAWIGGRWTTLWLPRAVSAARLIWLFWHELHHLYGLDHEEFDDVTTTQQQAITASFGGDVFLPEMPAAPPRAPGIIRATERC